MPKNLMQQISEAAHQRAETKSKLNRLTDMWVESSSGGDVMIITKTDNGEAHIRVLKRGD